MTTVEKIKQEKIIAIVRGVEKENIENTIHALLAGGISCIEVTMDSPNAQESLALAKKTFGDHILLGAGTVLNAASAEQVLDLGCDYILSPILDIETINLCTKYHKIAIPGVFTPTEAYQAYLAGASFVKVFPVSSSGPGYIKDMLGPLKQLQIIAVGGIDENNAASYLQAGSVAVGIGSSLVNKAWIEKGHFDQLTQKAKQLVKTTRGDT